jgi:hypothetical protein
MTSSLRRLAAVCAPLLLAVPLLATSPTAAAPATVPTPDVGARVAPQRAYQGMTSGGGFLNLKLTNVAGGKIKVTWKAKTPKKAIKRWVVRTSTSRDMKQHAKKYNRPKGARSALVLPASMVTPASGDYTFIDVTIIRRIPKNVTFTSPTRWIKAPVTTVPAGASSVVLGTFNVKSWNLESGASDPYAWGARSRRVYDTIVGSGAGVVAIQEASGSDDRGYSSVKNERQYNRINSDLNAIDPASQWALSNSVPFKVDGGIGSGRQGTRILYKSSEYTLLDQGFWKFDGLGADDICWIPYARLQQKSTGLAFTVLSAHLTTGNDPKGSTNGPRWRVRNQQAQGIIDKVAATSAAYPTEQVFVLGDMNSTIFTPQDNGVHRLFVQNGFYDAFASTTVISGEYPTTNDFHFPVVAEPHRRDYILSKGPLTGSYSYRNMAYTSAAEAASDHFMQVAQLPIGIP